MIATLRYGFENVRDTLANHHLPLLGRATQYGDAREPLRRPKAGEKEIAESHRLALKSLATYFTVARENGSLTITFDCKDRSNICPAAHHFAQYVNALSHGDFGNAPKHVEWNPRSTVIVRAPGEHQAELDDLLDYDHKRGGDLRDQFLEKELSSGSIFSAYVKTTLAELPLAIERRASLERDYPRIKIHMDLGSDTAKYLVRCLRWHVNAKVIKPKGDAALNGSKNG